LPVLRWNCAFCNLCLLRQLLASAITQLTVKTSEFGLDLLSRLSVCIETGLSVVQIIDQVLR
jgi:hypothetical protein